MLYGWLLPYNGQVCSGLAWLETTPGILFKIGTGAQGQEAKILIAHFAGIHIRVEKPVILGIVRATLFFVSVAGNCTSYGCDNSKAEEKDSDLSHHKWY